MLYIDNYILKMRIDYKKSSDLLKLNNSFSLDVQDIRQSHNIHHESHEKLYDGIDSRRKKLQLRWKAERCLPGRFAVVMTFCNSNDSTILQT